MEDPQAFSRFHIEAADVAFHIVVVLRNVAGKMSRAHNHNVLRHDGSGVKTHIAIDQINFLIVIELQIHNAGLAEAGYGDACFGIERDQPVTRRDVKDPLVFTVSPVGNTVSGKLAGGSGTARAFVFTVHPEHLAGGRVERNHGPPRSRCSVDFPFHHQGRGFVLILGSGPQKIGLEAPGDFEIIEVTGVDTVQRSISCAPQITTVGAPLAVFRAALRARCYSRD